ncbi:mechanosensitive ion channel [Anaerolineales bacterium HSG25]|nr:mechanosensitive ion channel [Anaerolineales bacterium HSG25]
MPNEDILFDMLQKILIFLERPVVQMQLITALIIIVLVLVLSKWLWSMKSRILPSWDDIDMNDLKQVYRQRLLVGTDYLIFPTLNIIAMTIAKNSFLTMGEPAGLLEFFIALSWAFLIYRFILIFLYIMFPLDIVRRYHKRLLDPLFYLFIVSQLIGQVTDLNQLAGVIIATLFEGDITLGAIFLATIGLYFWLDAVWGFQDISYRVITKYTNADPGAAEASLTLVRYVLIAVGMSIIFSSFNFNTATLAAITGGLSVGIGFALRETLSNFISGIILLFDGSLRPGDVVDMDGELSVVKRLDIRSTHVQTRNNVEIVIPNQTFFTSSFITYTGTDRTVRILIPAGASYNNDPEEVIKILEEVGQAHPEVKKEPKPAVFLVNFGDSSVDFKLAVWVDDPLRMMSVTSDLNRAIWQAFAKNNIEIPFPQQDLHVRSGISWEKADANLSALNMK